MANFAFVSSFTIEVFGSSKRAREKIGRIDRRDFRVPCWLAGLHVKKVIIETSVSDRIRAFSFRAIVKELQLLERSLYCFLARNVFAFNAYRVNGQSKSNRRNRTGSAFACAVRNQAV